MDHEYTTIEGPATIHKPAAALLLGESDPALVDGTLVTAQGLSGSGSLRILGDFIGKFFPTAKVYVTDPTWGNHIQIFNAAGLEVRKLPYWNATERCFDYSKFLSVLGEAPAHSVIVLHGCAHNPTGMDPTQEQWEGIASVMKEKSLIPFFDVAYQGFASGDMDKDAWPIRHFRPMFSNMFIAQSFAKNMGLYGERMGCMHIITGSKEEGKRVESQLKVCIRANYSSPPLYGARICNIILNSPELMALWRKEMVTMSSRIAEIRKLLVQKLEARLGCSPGTWGHITQQIGMFSFTGLTPKQCEVLIEKHHIYLLKTGRISLAGLNLQNIDYVVEAFADVIENVRDSNL
eukprot:GDKJ01009068.1.p1 GENE.GDKJ01009068.1~~GDKJ01009068.1.p1  ORF type:complete len:403 (+),score=92.99 GDKJ01009068.1:168-1211(+)